jgi:hypothetical protein
MRPEEGDSDLLPQLKLQYLRPGFAYSRLLDAVEALKAAHQITVPRLKNLQAWLRSLPGQNPSITTRIEAIIK